MSQGSLLFGTLIKPLGYASGQVCCFQHTGFMCSSVLSSHLVDGQLDVLGRTQLPQHLGCPFQNLPSRRPIPCRQAVCKAAPAPQYVSESDLLQNGDSQEHHPDALHHAPRSPFYTGGMDVMTAGKAAAITILHQLRLTRLSSDV